MHERFLRHACVLLAAAGLIGLAPRSVVHLVSSPAAAQTGDLAMRSGAVIERSGDALTVPTRPAQTIVAAPGDTVEGLATTFHSDAGALRWANNLVDVSEPAAGTPLLVPPGPGALVHVAGAERPSHFAARLGLDPRVLLDYNALHSDAPLRPGTYLQVPAALATADALAASAVVPMSPGVPGVASTQMGNSETNRFPWGQCTYYVATKRLVSWSGDAWAWFRNAQSFRRPEGQVPVQGAIAVTWGSWVGHVAYVERVNPDGSFVISEMNVRGVGVIDERTVTAASLDMIGFIY